jgi:hypothetical protein
MKNVFILVAALIISINVYSQSGYVYYQSATANVQDPQPDDFKFREGKTSIVIDESEKKIILTIYNIEKVTLVYIIKSQGSVWNEEEQCSFKSYITKDPAGADVQIVYCHPEKMVNFYYGYDKTKMAYGKNGQAVFFN